MASFFRTKIAHKLLSIFDGVSTHDASILSSMIKVSRNKCKHPQLLLPFNKLVKAIPGIGTSANLESTLKSLRNQGLPTAEGIIDIERSQEIPQSLVFTVDKHIFNRIVLLDISIHSSKDLLKNSCLLQNIVKKKILLELRSPTFGDNFTTDHFHSAIYFNFMSNIFEFLGMKLIRLNHIEDWGPSCGVLLAGYQHFGLDEELTRNALQNLPEVLKAVRIKSRNDRVFDKFVSDCIKKMENNDSEIILLWNNLKKKWLKEILSIYNQLGISFDETQCDSTLQAEIEKYSEELLQNEVIDLESENAVNMKVDASSSSSYQTEIKDIHEHALYSLARDVATAIQRKEQFNFQSMYFIGKEDRAEYYDRFFKILELLGYSWSSDLSHISVTNAQWLNRKKKTTIPIPLVLDKCKTQIIRELKTDMSLELDESVDEVADVLMVSGIVTEIFKHKRKDRFLFNIDDGLQFGEHSGIAYQFLHAGLLKIQELSDIKYNFEIDLSPLGEKEAVYLIQHLARFDEIVLKAYQYLEPYYIVQYVDSLCYFTKNAVDVLRLDIKGDKLRVIKARLLLFHATQKILCQCLKLLGLQPLEKIS